MRLTRLVSTERWGFARIARLVSAIALALLPLLLSTCRLDNLFQSRAPEVVITLAGDTVAVLDSVTLDHTVTVDGDPPKTALPLTWRSSNPDVADVDSTSGVVRGRARGTTVISVRLAPSALGEVSAEGRDTVQVIAASVTLAPGDTSMQSVGDTLCYRTTARDAAGGTITGAIPGLRILADPDTTVELVGGNGCVAARRTGAATTIEASLDTSKAAGTLTVRQHVTSLEIPVDNDTLFGLGSTETYPATLRDRRGNLAPAATVDWTSGNSSIISVDATGRATAQGEGVAYVRASADDGADSVSVTVVPSGPQMLAQLKSNGTTVLSVGDTTDESSVILRGRLLDPDADAAIMLDVEVRTVGTAFSNTPTATSAAVARGQTAAVTITGLTEDTDYHWQARARGESGRTSAWTSFGGNAETERDFRVAFPQDPAAPTGLGQFQSDGTTAIPVGQQASQTAVVFKGTVSDPDPGDRLRLEVELKRVGTAFDGTGTVVSTEVGTGAEVSVTVSGIPDDANYHWQARVVDQTGRAGPWTGFGSNPESQQDFNVPPLAEPPDGPTDPNQYQSDGTTAIAVGGIAFQSTVVLKGRLTDADPGDQLILQLEVRPVATAFTNAATHTSTAVASGGVASITVSGLSEDTEYHWQFRAEDQTLRASAWASFGANAESAADFRVALPEPPNAPTGLGQFRSNDAVIALGATIDERTVVFKATVEDPDPGDQLRLEVETKPIGTALDGTGTLLGASVSSGAVASVTVSNQGDDTSYHWRVRTVDQTGRTSAAWISFGGNSDGNPPGTPADVDYRIVVPEPPVAPASLAQFKSNGTTAIASGATTDETTVVLKATISDPDPTDQVRLDLEVRPVAQSFTGTPTHSSALGAGGTVQVSVSSLTDNTDYHWRARTLDGTGAPSAWVSFGGSDGTTDLRVAVPEDPGAPSVPGQFQSNGTTAIATGATTNENTVVFKATVSDPDPGDQLRLEVEVQPVGTAFANSPTATGSVAVASGAEASVTVTPLGSGTDYHWQARTKDQTGRTGPWVSFPTPTPNAESATDFGVDVPGAPNQPTTLQQFRSDGTTPIADGTTTNEKTVVFKATVSDPNVTEQVQLEVEVKPLTTAFTGSSTSTGSLVANGSTATVTVSNLGDDNDYHWRARAVDQNGAAGTWVEFPAVGTDFRVQVPESPVLPADSGQFKSNGTTAIVLGTATDENTVVLKARLTDPDPGNTIRLEVEVKPLGTAFNGAATQLSVPVASGAVATVTVPALTDDLGYHWRMRARDQSDSLSAWVSFGGNLESDADFRVAVPQAPALADSGQFKSNGTTPILLGTATDQNTVVLKARLTDPDPGDQLRLEVEVKRIGVPFDSVGTLTSAAVASGSYGSITVSALADDTTYHWRLRAIDQTGRGSAWIGFGNNLESAVDLRVAVPERPLDPTSLAQFKSDATTAITPTGATTDEPTVVLKATVTDPDPGATIRLEVEVKAVGTDFDGTGTVVGATGVAAGGTAMVTVTTLTDNTSYHWRARARDQSDSLSAWVSFPVPANAESAADFTVDVAPQPPAGPTGLGQFKSNGTTAIVVGTTTDENTVIFKATVTDPDPGAQIRLEVERQPLGTAFTNTPTATGSAAVVSGQVASVTIGAQVDFTSYHWQARAIDQNNSTSGWVSFGLPNLETDIDYRIEVQGPPLDPTGLGQFRSDGSTPITTGNTTDQSTVVFKATLTDSPPEQTVRLEVEVKAVTVAFTGAGTDTSAAVASGSTGQVTKTGLGDDTNYHWRARTLAGATRTSGWVVFGGNDDLPLPAATDFRVAVPQAPSVSELKQLKSFGTAAITVGDTTKSDSIVFRVRLTDPDPGDQVRFQVEWKLVGTAFDGLGTTPSSAVTSGDTAIVTHVGLVDDAAYHWRVRALDQSDSASAWVSFPETGNAESAVDFRVWKPESPSAPSGPDQFKSNGSTAIPTAESTNETTVIFKATVSDPDPGDSLRLEVERQPIGIAFTNVPTATSTTPVVTGQLATVTVTSHTDNTSYHWQIRTTDKTGRKSQWVSFGGNTDPADADYRVDTAPEDPALPSGFGQFKGDSVTSISLGGSSGGLAVVFKATLVDNDPGDLLQLEVEFKSTITPFNGTGTSTSPTVSSGQVAIIRATVVAGNYYWRARTCDQTARCSGWVSFGANSDGPQDVTQALNPAATDFMAP